MQNIEISIDRFHPYEGDKGNALAFVDATVNLNGKCLQFNDLKLYRTKSGIKLSEKQSFDPDLKTWAKQPPLIPSEVYIPLREALIERYESESVGQLQLI